MTIKSTVRIQCKHLVLSTSISLPRKRPFRSHMSNVGKLRFYQSKPIADQMIRAVFCDSVRRRSFGHWQDQDKSPLSPSGIELRFIVYCFKSPIPFMKMKFFLTVKIIIILKTGLMVVKLFCQIYRTYYQYFNTRLVKTSRLRAWKVRRKDRQSGSTDFY